jgi:anti-anti-sigma factor
MQIRKSEREDILVIQVNGRLDGNSANQLSEELASDIREGWRQIELDLADLVYLSSAGLRILLKYAKTMKELRGSFVVTRISDFARQVLEVAGIFELLLPTYRDETSSVRHGRVVPIPEGAIEMYDLEEGGTLSCQILGAAPDSRSLLDPSHSHPLPFPVSSFAFGVGAFAHDPADCYEHFGNFLAAGGVAACMPPDEGVLPDYMIYAEDFIPKLHVLTGLSLRGDFVRQICFEMSPPHTLLIPEAISHGLAAVGGQLIGFVAVFEAVRVCGSALRKIRGSGEVGQTIGGLVFRKEPLVWEADSLVMLAGVASVKETSSLGGWLQPWFREPDLLGCAHAAVFSYQPLRKGFLRLKETVNKIFDQDLRGVVQLDIEDAAVGREGRSQFRRGVLWASPVVDVAVISWLQGTVLRRG